MKVSVSGVDGGAGVVPRCLSIVSPASRVFAGQGEQIQLTPPPLQPSRPGSSDVLQLVCYTLEPRGLTQEILKNGL